MNEDSTNRPSANDSTDSNFPSTGSLTTGEGRGKTRDVQEDYVQPFRRREFLKVVGAGGVGFVAPMFLPARVFGANERIHTGHIGVGGQGRSNLKALLPHAIAVCDVDQRHAQQAAKMVTDAGMACEVYSDYRRLLERTDIDAVVISTPDHWHALQTIHACQAGKDVYVEKPLSLTIAAGRRMVQAARDHQRIVQTGSQQRSSENFRRACELVRSGALGKVHTVHVGIAAANHPFQKREPVPNSKPPEHLDFNLWLGPAPLVEYNELKVHYNFRFFWDYSGGQMTNWGAHHIDIAHWGMGWDNLGPKTISGSAEFHPAGWHDVSEACRITYEYPNGAQMIVGQRQADIAMGTKFIGDHGWIFVDRGKLQASDPELLKRKLSDADPKLRQSNNHHEHFLECIKSRELPICDVEIGHRTATACHLGNIAIRTRQVVHWDHEAEQILGDKNLENWVDRNDREF